VHWCNARILFGDSGQVNLCTEHREDRENERFTDVLDLQLLAELIEVDGWAAVREGESC
jgi:hypothetical protein